MIFFCLTFYYQTCRIFFRNHASNTPKFHSKFLLKIRVLDVSYLIWKKWFGHFLGAYALHGPEVRLIRTNNAYLRLQITQLSIIQKKFFMAYLRNSVRDDSCALLTFKWGSKIVRMAIARTWRRFLKNFCFQKS